MLRDDAQGAGCRTLVSLLEHRAGARGADIAYRFLASSGNEDSVLTYGALRHRVARMARHLADAAAPGDRVVLLLPPGLDYVSALYACQYAGVVAVPAYPPNPRRPDSRVAGIVADCGARVAIVSTALHHRLAPLIEASPTLARVAWLEAEQMLDAPADELIRPAGEGELAFLQYTSGSTGDPRGVMLPHRAVMHNLGVIHGAARHREGDEILFWVPPYHDMGLIGAILQPLYAALPGTLMAPSTFSQRPIRWLEAMTRYGATTSGAPNFAYDLCVERVSDEERSALDLSRWRIAISGAEPVHAATLDRFASTFAAQGFRRSAFLPCYGLAETTLFASGRSQDRPPTILSVDRGALEVRSLRESAASDATRLVSAGPPAPELRVRIVDPDVGAECAPNTVGEIWIAGASVASGYWGRPEETEALFGGRLPGSDERFLRTGDLGALHDGELVVTGRIKDLVIVGGRNFYPQDIERAAEHSHPSLRTGSVAAFSAGTSPRERVVLVAEVVRHHRASVSAAVVAGVRSAVANVLGLVVDDVVLIRQGTLPKTSSGKLQRRRTRDLHAAGELAGIDAHPLSNAAPPVGHGERTSAEHATRIRQWLRAYARDHLDSFGMDERREMPAEVRRDFATAGLFGLQAPTALGGLAMAHVDVLRVVEQLAAIDLTLATFVGGHNSLGIRPLVRHATPAVRDLLVPALARGEQLAALALTEPSAGSNPWAIDALAVPADGGWHLHGVKSWIGSAGVAGVFNVFARVPGDDGGITAFALLADTPGLRIGDEALTLGMRSMLQNAVHLEGAFVGGSAVLGHVGGGIDVAHDTFLHARFGVAAMCLGGIKRSLQLAQRYASRRKVVSGRLLDHPVTRARLGGMAASAAALDAYLSVVAEALDGDTALGEDALIICKTSAPELLWEAVDGAMQLLGGRGYVESNPVAQLLRDARLLRIFEGPTEPLLVHLGARVLRDGGAIRSLLTDRLGAPDIATRLVRAAQQATDRLSAHGAGRATASQWAALLVGSAATEATMLASARVARARGTPGGDLAIARFEERFETAVARCTGAHAEERAALLGQNLDAAFAWANDAVGDVEQRTNGALDPMLQREWSEALREPVRTVREPRVRVAPAASRSLAFILEWLSDEFQLPADAANAETSLRDHGLDSLAATRLVVALEGHLGRRVDASLLWRSATIGEFASAVDGTRTPDIELPVPTSTSESRSDAHAVEEWPEYRALRSRLSEAIGQGSTNPFFNVHEGISGATARVGRREMLNFSSYNYLGLSGHPAVTAAAQAAAELYGTSVSASRVASGERPIHAELERALADFAGTEDALVFVGGHATNVSVLSHLFGPGDLVLCDAFIHNSALQGAAFSGARWVTFPHNDWAACDAMLVELRRRHRRAIVVIEGAYSADGDVPDLARFVELRKRHGAMLMVDEAHSLGVLGATGRGIVESAGMTPDSVDILMGTLSKSLASCGGYIAGSAALVEYLKYTAPGFVYSVGITPPNAAAALAALRVLSAEPERVTRVRENAARFAHHAREAGLDTGRSAGTGVIPVMVGDSLRAVRMSQALFARGINVQPMISPSVPNDEARLRFFVSCEHTDAQLRLAVNETAAALASDVSTIPESLLT